MSRRHFQRRYTKPEWLLYDALTAHYWQDHKEAWALLTQVAASISDDKLVEPRKKDINYGKENYPH